MPLTALKATSTARNGVGAFIKPCVRMDFHFCDWAGSSRGMLTFLKHNLEPFASASPSTEMHVSPRPHRHPVIRAHYVGGASRAVCVRNLDHKQVLAKAQLLLEASGQQNKKLAAGRNVRSLNDGVRGVWSGMHGDYAAGEGVWEKMRAKKQDA